MQERESWVTIAEALKANPGRWAIVLTSAERPAVNRARNALTYHKVTTRQRTADGVISVWACFKPAPAGSTINWQSAERQA